MRGLARAIVAFLLVCPAAGEAQTPVDADLLAYVNSIRAVDNHAHPLRPVRAGAPADSEFDALPLDGIPPFSLPWRLRLENPEWLAAARTLWGVRSADTSAAGREALRNARARTAETRADGFPEWALDQMGIEVMLANRIVLGAGLAAPRFRWVPFADPLLFPLDTRVEAARTPDTRALYPKEAALLRRYLRELGLAELPATLDAYVRSVLNATLEREHQRGAVAVKFEAAYLRPLDFDAADAATARRIYAKYVRGRTPTRGEYKVLQDYLFREIARTAGRLGMAVHIHMFEGFGSYYSAAGSDPRLLESALNDSTLRATPFVIIHGGWPQVGATQALLARPNVYADLSMMDLVLEPAQLAAVLRQWLGEYPEKLLFGTDAFDGGPDQNWADVGAFAASTARRALALALTGMMRDGEITRERARQLARMVLRQNASTLYKLGLN
jgi:predicted TIM-barrel fold metal-dependent hydrolase